MHIVYILYSSSADRYYVGETEDLNTRLAAHIANYFKGSGTSMAKDWQVMLTMKVCDRAAARRVEHYIKGMKSRKFLERLIRDDQFYEGFRSRVLGKFNINILD